MNIHEYQAKELLKRYHVPVPEGSVAYSDKQAVAIAERLGGERWIIKAQIHAGGRGEAGGIKVAHALAEVARIADRMIGSKLVTRQTGPEGKLVRRVLVERALKIERELYLALLVDRQSQGFLIIASPEGGMEIEEVAARSPEKIYREAIDPTVGLLDFQCRKVASVLGLRSREVMQRLSRILKGLYRCFRERDALLIEINPLAVVEGSELVCLDAKMHFDDNALFRQSEINELRDLDEEDPREVEASGHGLNYIALDGNIGCIVNGAGLAMATLDAIVLHEGRPANFLDVGGGASPEKVENACRIVMGDPKVKVLLINIFAGINRCDWIAEGLIRAYRDLQLRLPMVVRLAGTNAHLGQEMLQASGLPFIQAENLDDAARKAVEAARRSTP